LQQISYRLATD